MKRSWDSNWPGWAALLVVSSVALSTLFVNAINGDPVLPWLADTGLWSGILRVGVIVLYLALVWQTAVRIGQGLPIRSAQELEFRPRKVLVLPISTPNGWSVSLGEPPVARGPTPADEIPLRRGDLAQVCTSDQRWNWLPALRAVRHHLEALERVIVVVSKEGAESGDDDRLRRLIEYLTPASLGFAVDVHPARNLDFNEIDVLYATLSDIVDSCKDQGYRDSDITVDATGGTKPLSIAAAFTTLHTGVTFQYMADDGPKLYQARLLQGSDRSRD